MNETFATKSDLKELELRMDSRFTVLEVKFQELEFKLTTRLGGLITALFGIAVALIRIH